jgi:hypothetical protein
VAVREICVVTDVVNETGAEVVAVPDKLRVAVAAEEADETALAVAGAVDIAEIDTTAVWLAVEDASFDIVVDDEAVAHWLLEKLSIEGVGFNESVAVTDPLAVADGDAVLDGLDEAEGDDVTTSEFEEVIVTSAENEFERDALPDDDGVLDWLLEIAGVVDTLLDTDDDADIELAADPERDTREDRESTFTVKEDLADVLDEAVTLRLAARGGDGLCDVDPESERDTRMDGVIDDETLGDLLTLVERHGLEDEEAECVTDADDDTVSDADGSAV